MDSLSLPLDLIIEILVKLPPISVHKLICLSKLWSSIIKGKYFTDLYLTRSSSRPLLLLPYGDHDTRIYHSYSQDNPSSYHNICLKTIPGFEICSPVRGLICCTDRYSKVLIANPSTGQVLTLPGGVAKVLFGYDDVNDLYKVFSFNFTIGKDGYTISKDHRFFTLGDKKEWRAVECKYQYYPKTEGLCKNGFLYYIASDFKAIGVSFTIVCIDMRSEEFSLITLPEGVQIRRSSDLVNYNGKIALVNNSIAGEFNFWVLMDVDKHEWVKAYFKVPCWKELVGKRVMRCMGTINNGEIIFAPRPLLTNPYKLTIEYFIIYYDPKKDKVRRVDLERSSLGLPHTKCFMDHIENTMFLPM
ncbi:unnamed protein product [Cochlearia groenlandica]